MRKLKLQVQTTVDGFIAGENGEMDWMTFPWTEDIERYVNELTEPVDTIILGRNLAEGFIPHWAGVAADHTNPEQASGKRYTDTAKIVFTKTLDNSKWENTTLAKGDIVEEVTRLKALPGGDIIVYGGATFVSSLVKNGLIDEYHLFVNQSAIGNGMPIFRNLSEKQNLKLIKSIPFECGIVLLNYQVNKD